MKKLLDQVLRTSGRLDAFVEEIVTRKLRGDRTLTPSELLAAMTADAERHITLGAEGPLFPYNRIAVHLKAANATRLSELRGALTANQVTAAIAERLRRQCRVPDDLRADLRITAGEDAAAPAYDIEFRTVPVRRQPVENEDAAVARLVRADNLGRFTLREGTFNVGRVAEAHGRDGRLIRLNQIVLDTETDSRTVSRVHARILGTRGEQGLSFQVFDDGSRHGSTIVRGGRAHKVHRGAIGVTLKDGDEVYFGKVRLEFRMR